MEAKAIARYVRVSPRKARIVVDQVRGKSVIQAREILAFTNRGVAEAVEKTLNSAVANAEHQHHVRPESLIVKTAFVDEGPTPVSYTHLGKGLRGWRMPRISATMAG